MNYYNNIIEIIYSKIQKINKSKIYSYQGYTGNLRDEIL